MPPALQGIEWELVKVDFMRLRSEGINQLQAFNELSERYDVSRHTIRYHHDHEDWSKKLNGLRAKVEGTLSKKLTLTADKIAESIATSMLKVMEHVDTVEVKEAGEVDSLASAVLKLSQVRSRYNPDGQEKAQGATLFQVNVNSAPVETKPVIEMNSTETPETTP